MRNAPSVSYPVGRCSFQRWLFTMLVLLTSAVLSVWALSQGLTFAWWLAVSAAVIGICLGWIAARSYGVLTWDGQVWCLHDQVNGQPDALGDVQVVLDVQKALLLRWQPASGTLHTKPQWLWLGSQNLMNRWQDLRRAVYQRGEM